MRQQRNSRLIPFLTVLILLLLSFGLLVFLTERPVLLFRTDQRAEGAAALAIRDNVIPFQKFGTRLFTLPLLKRSYKEVVYLTEYSAGEGRAEFVASLKRLLTDHKVVDIYLLAHANRYYEWLQEVDSSQRRRIRLVYNTGCSGAEQQEQWLGLGARCYIAHASSESISPVFYFYFLRRWSAGASLSEATQAANECMRSALQRLGAPVDSALVTGSCGTCYGECERVLKDE